MRFNRHYLPQNRPHAFLSASKYGWIKHDEEKLERAYMAHLAAAKGTELHALAAKLIEHQQKLPETTQTMNLYVNDCIGFRMSPELVLFVSENCYGTADALGFRLNPKTGKLKLRVFDLKTGINQTSFNQLLVYAAMFCIEYKAKPFEIEIELRIYQNDDVRIEIGDPDVITHIIDKILTFDRMINAIREEM